MTKWNKEAFEKVRIQIRAQLDRQTNQKARSAFITRQIKALESDVSPEGCLTRFLYILFSLSDSRHHKKFQATDIERLSKLGTAILQVNGVQPQKSRLSFLYRDLHLIRSQLFRKAGLKWFSIWEHFLAYHSLKRGEGLEERHTEHLSLAIRASRLGECDLALSHLDRAENETPDSKSKFRILIERVRLLKLKAEIGATKELIMRYLNSPISEAEKRDLGWEHKCCTVFGNHAIEPLLTAVRRGGTHHEPSYAIETFLRSRAVSTVGYIEKFRTVALMSNGLRKEFSKYGVRYQVCKALIDCYDKETPFSIRFSRAEEIADLARKLPSLEEELLTWCALARWLSRNNQTDLAALVISEYKSLSLRISDGNLKDVLGIASDMLESTWYEVKKSV